MKRAHGFTVIELLVLIVLLSVGGWLFFTEKAAVEATQRDDTRKVAINAMYYALEEVYYEKNHFYPQTIDSKTLRSIDPALFTDPLGIKLGDSGSNYRYETSNCDTDGHCANYTLRADLEREDDYVKTNRSH